jgi:uncharacterized membrane protein YfcA
MMFIPLGVLAGVLTTVAGMGGGILLQLALALAVGPRMALAITAPALLIGNLHRAIVYRDKIDPRVGRAFALGALPGSVLGGLAAVSMPVWVIHALMLGMTALAILRATGRWSWSPSSRQIVPAAAGIGAISATSGGAGLLVSPVMMAAGLTGERYIATTAVAAVAMHVGRLTAYSAGGLVTRETLTLGAMLTLAILAGNTLGTRVRKLLPENAGRRIELGTLCVCVTLALVGAAH